MDSANAFIEPPQRPATLDEAEQIIAALWRLLQDCREQLALNSGNSSLPPSQDRLSGKAKDRLARKPSGKKRGAQEGHVAPHPRPGSGGCGGPHRTVFSRSPLRMRRRDRHRSDAQVPTPGVRSPGDRLFRHRASALRRHLPVLPAIRHGPASPGDSQRPDGSRPDRLDRPDEAISASAPAISRAFWKCSGGFTSVPVPSARPRNRSPSGWKPWWITSAKPFARLQWPTPMRPPTSAGRAGTGCGCCVPRSWLCSWSTPPAA